MSDQVFYLFSAVLLGLVLGALFMYFASGANKESKQTIEKLETKLNDYQQGVSTHFEQTADLVDELTQSYKKVFDHLNKSARELMTEEQIQLQIEKRKGNKITLQFLTEETDKPEDLPTEKIEEPLAEPTDLSELVENEQAIDNLTDVQLDATTIEESIEPDEVADGLDLEQEVKIREKNIYS